MLNVVPPQRAGAIARAAGVVTANDRWCDVDFLTFESVKVKNVHVLGDAIQIATGMPKSGHMANQHAKVCAAAVVSLLAGQPPNPAPVLTNTCYSMITDRDSVHVCSVHRYDNEKKTVLPVAGAGRRIAGDEQYSKARMRSRGRRTSGPIRSPRRHRHSRIGC